MPQPPKLCPKIILEGTRLTQKTDIAFALNEHPRIVGPRKYRYHSPVISAEWCGFSNFPWGRGPINFETHKEEEISLEIYRTWARMFELQRYYSWIVDRFHISTMVYQAAAHKRKYSFQWLEKRLLPLGFCIVHCVRDEDGFPAARSERLKISGKPSQYDDLSIFIAEQQRIRDAVSNSLLPHVEINVTDDNIEAACDRIADYLEENELLGLME